MKSGLLSLLAVVVIFFIGSAQLRADELEALDFDIFRSNGAVALRLDLAPLISSNRVEQMNEGIDMAIDCQLSLRRPRKLWGSETILEKHKLLKVGYRLVTEEYRLGELTRPGIAERTFISLAKLHQYLADSVIVSLGDIDKLDKQNRYYIDLKLTCISLTSFNLAADAKSGNNSESPVKFLFRQFLDVTNFGREDYELRSRPFSLDDLESSK